MMIATMDSSVDPELKAIHVEAIKLYNRETALVRAKPTSQASINATNFLADQAVTFADAALYLMEDARQPITVPAALLRTCLEAQAKANYIISVAQKEREDRAGELIRLMNTSHEYYRQLVIQSAKDTVPNESKLLPRDAAYFPALKALCAETDTSNLKVVKKEYDELSRAWAYGKVVEKNDFENPQILSRSEAQPLQRGFYLLYVQCCSFVHCDPSSLQHQQLLTRIGLTYSLVFVEVIAILSFFTALGKEQDGDLLNLKRRIIAFDVNERVLPKSEMVPKIRTMS